jgi:hypothetical protein
MTDNNKLSAEQIMNWRRVLSLSFGPYALIMPDHEVQSFRDSMQEGADQLVILLKIKEIRKRRRRRNRRFK